MKRLAEEHVHENLEDYVHGSIPASTRRILFTKWVGKAWEQISSNRDMVVRSFNKCGITIPIDGSKGEEINIKDLPEYTVGESSADSSDTDSSDEQDPFEDIINSS